MPIGSVSLNYTLNNFEIKKTFDTRINIKTELEFLRFGSKYQPDALGLAYVSSPSIDTEKNILLIDNSNGIKENAKEAFKEELFLNDNFEIGYAGFDIADVFKEIDGIETPLYYWHDLSSAQSFNNLEILDSNKQPVDPKLWMYIDESQTLGTTRKGIYSNLVCELNKTERSYEIYFVRYKDLITNQVVETLLDSQLYYEQASYFSERNKREYILTQQNGKYFLNIVFDSYTYSPTPSQTSQRYSLRRRSFSKVILEKPGLVPTSERWNMKITPGDFYHNGYKYWVPEYYLQMFSPAFPYRFIKENKGTVVNNRLIYLEKHPIANLGISGYYLYIIFKESNGTVKRCFTNDPDADTYVTKQGFVTDIFYEKDGIKSVSANSGFILMNEDIPQDQEVYVTCRYVERYYNYEYLSVNPSINPDILGKKLVFYMIPDASERSVHHLAIDDNGVIVDASESPLFISFDGAATSGALNTLTDLSLLEEDYFTGYELEILSGVNSGFKTKIASYDKDSKTIFFNETLDLPIVEKTTYRIIKKIEPYYSNGHSYIGWNGLAENNAYFKIGEVHVVQTLSLSDISMLDTRVLGGGIREKEIEAALKLQNEVSWYWDIGNWDGTAYPGMGAILVHLPRYILKEMGGDFEREQVEDIVKRHVASGSYVIIRYYDESTEISNIEPGDKQVKISWNLINANQYNIYIGSSPDNLSLYSVQPGTRTSVVITGLENDKSYYVQVAPIVGGIERLGSKILGFMPFNYSNTLPPVKYGEERYIQGSYV